MDYLTEEELYELEHQDEFDVLNDMNPSDCIENDDFDPFSTYVPQPKKAKVKPLNLHQNEIITDSQNIDENVSNKKDHVSLSSQPEEVVGINENEPLENYVEISTEHSEGSSSSSKGFGKRSMPGKRARRHFSQLSEFEKGLIIGMKTAGWSTRRVAGQVDRLECAIRNCWEQWTREGTHMGKTRSGATRKTTRREDRRIVWQALVNPTGTRSTIRADVGIAIVLQTISRHLAEANLKSKRPFRALPLTPEHQRLRLQWCQARSMWNVTDWQKVVFSDESRFVLGTDDNRVRVWSPPG
ncbi:transposable element Tc1 transposase [Trichonephila clavipes]|uniref:Transposable element Tc1 transposase n=1 Tax=Trichonephila clavipes TaxID=2585209 RepID=A0A8X7BBW8_TRICX|nr:transposable element Tc1 transposase [Trichonephila clavipes]